MVGHPANQPAMETKAETMQDLITRAAETIAEYGLIAEGDNVLAAFSGGPDSVAMLYILHQLQSEPEFSLAAVYVNHRLRPRAAKKEARFCEAFCGRYDIPFSVEEVDIPKLSRTDKTGIEETARAYRYRTLNRLAEEKGYTKIAVGHHRNDRAETILFNLSRGASRHGLTGMPPRRGKIIRPLYDIGRREIADFLEENGLEYMIDRSNLSRKFTRNRIRRKVIPVLEREISEAAVANIIRFSEIMAGEELFLDKIAAAVHDKLVSTTPGGKIRLDLSHKLDYDKWLKRRLVFKILADAGLDNIRFDEVERLAAVADGRSGERISVREGFLAERSHDGLYLYRPGAEIVKGEVKIPGEVRLDYPRVRISFEYVRPEAVKKPEAAGAETAYVDGEAIDGPLTVAGLKKGVRFHPYGRPGSKKVGDFLTDQKYPRPLRDELPVVYDRKGVVWLAGLEIDQRVRIRDETREIVKIEIGKN